MIQPYFHRRIYVDPLRLKLSDFQTTRNKHEVHLLGKGRNGGKPHSLPWHRGMAIVPKAYLGKRDTMRFEL